jgi:hypothetical protein
VTNTNPIPTSLIRDPRKEEGRPDREDGRYQACHVSSAIGTASACDQETPVFREIKAKNEVAKLPLVEVLTGHRRSLAFKGGETLQRLASQVVQQVERIEEDAAIGAPVA